MIRYRKILILLLAIALLTACRPAWTLEVAGPEETLQVERATFEALADFVTEVEGEPALPLERLLYVAGAELVSEVHVLPAEGATRTLTWEPEIAANAWLRERGELELGGEHFTPRRVEVVSVPVLAEVEASILDVAPTAAAALGLPAPAEATGQALPVPRSDHVLIVLLDGFGYVRYQEALERGEAPFLTSLEPPRRGITVYPPVTVVAMGSLLTGAPPEVHGVTRRSLGRTTETETIFDVAAEAGLRVVAVEGDAVVFNLRNAELLLSGDRDGDGFTVDNVLANALGVVEEGPPDLFFVHFHDIDDAGHAVGPGAPEEREALKRVDAALATLVDVLPSSTLVIVVADHGMHAVEGGGDHGHLIERDVLIPVFAWVTE